MKFIYEFSRRAISDDKLPIITILVKNKENTTSIGYDAMLDSGAFMNVVHASVADILGIDLRNIKQEVSFQGVGTSSRKSKGKLCIVELTVFQKRKRYSFDAPILFSDTVHPNSIPLLGRQGFFDKFSEVSFQFSHNKFLLSV